MSTNLTPVAFSNIKKWRDDDHLAAYNCFRRSARRMMQKPYTTKQLGIDANDLAVVAKIADETIINDGETARQFFEFNFTPHSLASKPFNGMLTGYYEPELSASLTRTDKFKYPLYSRPDDLIDLDETNRPATIEQNFMFARKTNGAIIKYFTRHQIQNGALDNRGLELVWLDNPIDVFFTHIQGSARLTLEDGTFIRVSYAAKSGHPYTAIGKLLVEAGHFKLEDITMQSIRDWLKENPSKRDDLFAQNQSYIFFQITDQPDIQLGPVAAASVALTAGRSMAIDHRLHTFGSPIWVATKDNFVGQNKTFSRLLIAQDTGSAIVGRQRGDLFVGSGREAGIFAGQIKHAASMIVFVPNSHSGK